MVANAHAQNGSPSDKRRETNECGQLGSSRIATRRICVFNTLDENRSSCPIKSSSSRFTRPLYME